MSNKVVLITGASQGIGARLAVCFAGAGYDIAINCLDQENLDKNGAGVARECRAHGVKAECFIADVSDFAACESMVKAVVSEMGTIDVLINNAGITRDGLVARMSEENFDTVININLKSAFNMIRHTSGVMIKKRSGSIINMASVAGLYGNAGQANYSASKAGLIGMTKTVAKELGGRGITCNAIAPGFIQSAMTDVLPDKLKESILGMISLRRFGDVEDVAKTALFLAEHGYITGQVIEVSGGLAM